METLQEELAAANLEVHALMRERQRLQGEALGGMASPAGSCVWHVVGCEWTVKDWALSRGWNGRPLRLETASGILVGSLGMLQGHFGL